MKKMVKAIGLAILMSLGMAPFECSRYGEPKPVDMMAYDIRYNVDTDLVLHAEVDAGSPDASLEDGDGCFIDEEEAVSCENFCLADDR